MTPNKSYDIVIIGGGINGVGIARECAMRNLSVALFEKEDFASGTSSQSSKLAHGGLRYLEQGDIKLVFEACHEREQLLKAAPHIVHPLPFLIPIYNTSRRPKWQLKIGLWLYDILSAFKTTKTHRMLSAKEALAQEPGLKKEGLVGGALYYDAQMDDSRLVIETMLQAESYGAECFNYTAVTAIEHHNDTSTVTIQESDGTPQTISTKLIINTAGPWSDDIAKMVDPAHQKQLRPSKGIHLITKPLTQHNAILLTAKQDGRVFFVIPWHGYSMIGTTDTDYTGDINVVRSDKEDIDYLIDATNQIFPENPITKDDIITTFAGLRPLIQSTASTASAVSREHKIVTTQHMISLFGGKFTTYRKMAEDVARVITKELHLGPFKPLTEKLPLWGGEIQDIDAYIAENINFDTKIFGISREHYTTLLHRYGSAYLPVLKIIDTDPDYRQELTGSTILKGEVIYAIRVEKAKTITDVMRRRTQLKLSPGNGLQCLDEVAALFAKELHLSENEITQQKETYIDLVKRSASK